MLEADLIAQFRALSTAYIEASDAEAPEPDGRRKRKRTPGTVWAAASNDARFLKRLEAGGAFTARTYDRVVLWFDQNWPAGAAWPECVPRPSAAPSVPRAGWRGRFPFMAWGGKRNGCE